MENTFIESNSLATVSGGRLFYPASGQDWDEVLLLFADYVDEFHFCDLEYEDLTGLGLPFKDSALYRAVEKPRFEGPLKAEKQPRTRERAYPELEPGWRTDIYERVSDGRRLTVVRRRGFGQCALAEFSERSIGVFVHRGDTPISGDGGSNLHFLANRKRDYEPSSNLFDKLAHKLSDRALIVSDGSNAGPRFLKRFYWNCEISGADAFGRIGNKQHSFGGFHWRCVGYIRGRCGPTLVWQVARTGPA